MYREIVEFFQIDHPKPSIYSDYVVLRNPSWCSTNAVEHKRCTSAPGWKTSWTVTALWTFLSVLVTVTCTIGFVETEWFVRENTTLPSPDVTVLSYDRNSLVYTLGMFNVCYRDMHQTAFRCHRFGVSRFPSICWQMTCFLYGAGCVLQGCGAVLLVVSLLHRDVARRMGAHLVSHAYVVAGFLQTLGLLLYPMILDTHVGQLHCGADAHAYGPALCRIGWAYVAATAGTLLTFYCPFLAYFSFYRVYAAKVDPDSRPEL